jgi:hypothetical protein
MDDRHGLVKHMGRGYLSMIENCHLKTCFHATTQDNLKDSWSLVHKGKKLES